MKRIFSLSLISLFLTFPAFGQDVSEPNSGVPGVTQASELVPETTDPFIATPLDSNVELPEVPTLPEAPVAPVDQTAPEASAAIEDQAVPSDLAAPEAAAVTDNQAAPEAEANANQNELTLPETPAPPRTWRTSAPG